MMATLGMLLAFIVSGPLFAPQASSPGLQADYWENTVTPNPAPTPPAPPAGAPTRSAVQTVIDFDDTNGSNTPAAPVLPWIVTPLDNFFSRWTGYVRGPVSGTVTFETYSDDGVELRINNTAVVTNWTFHGPTLDTGTFAMTLGVWYPIRALHFEGGGQARMRLRWSYAGQALQVIPSTHLNSTLPPPPAAPVITGGTAGDGLGTPTSIDWTSVDPGTEFRVYRDGALLATVPATQFSYTDNTAQLNTTYCYAVTVVNGSESVPSNQLCLTPMLPPPRVNDHTEGFFDDNCACGSSIGAAPGALFAALLGLALLGRRRPR